MNSIDPRAPFAQNDDSAGGAMPRAEDVRAIGDIIRDTRNLSAQEVEAILVYQREHGVRFGEAAIALKLATSDDVLRALALQFNYAFGGEERQRLSPELVALNQPFGHQSEAIRAIRAQIMLRSGADGAGPRVKHAIAVISPDVGDGKTFFCANLAVSLAQLGARTLVIDADLRGPRMHEVFSVTSQTGLSSLLAGRRGEGVIKAVKGVPNLFVLPVGVSPPNPLELVEGPAFGALLQELLGRFDHVLVDTPAGVYGADNAVVASRCGLALIIARKNASRVESLQDLVHTMVAANAQIAGVVMNEF
jgi:chain length determinant protein tyrosine kinase EpsG